ncbi:MAG: hypothetical protein B7Z37_05945 [Verrucomicrobia bacterium 12-59-8]|nr:MAG: hypothetical protein B7Z37_05945 [Verrucomicrobia bacterium 12-59-8]
MSMKLNLARLEKIRQRGSRIIARCPACAGINSQASFSSPIRRQKPVQNAPLLPSAALTREARCRASDSLETQARMASWRLRLRPDMNTAGESDFLAMVDAGMENLTLAGSAAALQLFTLRHS